MNTKDSNEPEETIKNVMRKILYVWFFLLLSYGFFDIWEKRFELALILAVFYNAIKNKR